MEPRYELRAQLRGTLLWLCPFCGYINRHKLQLLEWRVRCSNRLCKRVFAVGLVLHSLVGVQHSGGHHRHLRLPCDFTCPSPRPGEAFPVARLEVYPRWGAPLNRLVSEEPTETQTDPSPKGQP